MAKKKKKEEKGSSPKVKKVNLFANTACGALGLTGFGAYRHQPTGGRIYNG